MIGRTDLYLMANSANSARILSQSNSCEALEDVS